MDVNDALSEAIALLEAQEHEHESYEKEAAAFEAEVEAFNERWAKFMEKLGQYYTDPGAFPPPELKEEDLLRPPAPRKFATTPHVKILDALKRARSYEKKRLATDPVSKKP